MIEIKTLGGEKKKIDKSKIKLIAMDLDGTLTQHKQPLDAEHKRALDALSKRYKLLMVGAGQARRIFNQMEAYPIDIIGNYGLQYAVYNKDKKDIDILRDEIFETNKEEIESKVTYFREKYNFSEYRGENVEYHSSGCITFPILGTKAIQEDKLAFDPDRKKRRLIYNEVLEAFSDYNVFVGGSSSFDMSPKPYNKYYALELYCKENGINHESVVYIGDDYGYGGNDESIYNSDFNYLTIDNYEDFPVIIKPLVY
ncbi:MAG: HAD-IIB family hydrolase [Clostridia bacterium]|nr:HAD-IIB family hydrolase [Clostridia bacterium]